jgi:hypothetical protein
MKVFLCLALFFSSATRADEVDEKSRRCIEAAQFEPDVTACYENAGRDWSMRMQSGLIHMRSFMKTSEYRRVLKAQAAWRKYFKANQDSWFDVSGGGLGALERLIVAQLEADALRTRALEVEALLAHARANSSDSRK